MRGRGDCAEKGERHAIFFTVVADPRSFGCTALNCEANWRHETGRPAIASSGRLLAISFSP